MPPNDLIYGVMVNSWKILVLRWSLQGGPEKNGAKAVEQPLLTQCMYCLCNSRGAALLDSRQSEAAAAVIPADPRAAVSPSAE